MDGADEMYAPNFENGAVIYISGSTQGQGNEVHVHFLLSSAITHLRKYHGKSTASGNVYINVLKMCK